MPRRLPASEAGYVLVTALIALAVMALLSAAAVRQANSALRTADQAVRSEQALYLANAGVEWALASYRAGTLKDHTGTLELGEGRQGTYVVRVEPEDNGILVTSEGTVRQGSQITSRTITAVISREQVGEPLIQVGGSLKLDDGGTVCGDLWVGGDIETRGVLEIAPPECERLRGTGQVSVGGSIRGSVWSPVEVLYECPSGGTGCFTPPPVVVDLDQPSGGGGGRDLEVDQTRTVEGDLRVDGSLIIKNGKKLKVTGNLFVAGSMEAGNGSEVTIGGDAVVIGSITAENGSKVGTGGSVQAMGGFAVENGAGVEIGRTLEVIEKLQADNGADLEVGGDLHLKGDMDAENGSDVDIDGEVRVTGDVEAEGKLSLGEDVYVGGTLTTESFLTLRGVTRIGGDFMAEGIQAYPRSNSNPIDETLGRPRFSSWSQ